MQFNEKSSAIILHDTRVPTEGSLKKCISMCIAHAERLLMGDSKNEYIQSFMIILLPANGLLLSRRFVAPALPISQLTEQMNIVVRQDIR